MQRGAVARNGWSDDDRTLWPCDGAARLEDLEFMLKHAGVWVAIFTVIALMFLQLPPIAAKHDAVLRTYGAIIEVDALVKQQFVRTVDDETLVAGAISGLLDTLDPYSGYIAPEDLPRFIRWRRGDYVGFGLEVGVLDERLMVIAAIEGGPAAMAGVLAGDAILAIDGEELERLSVFEAYDRLQTKEGQPIQLSLQRHDFTEPHAVTIIPGPVSLHTVAGFERRPDGQWDHMIDPDEHLGYIRISKFNRNTMRDFEAALDRLRQAGMRGLILDLRFNPGGLMTQAIAMIDRFVDEGLILETVTRHRAVHTYLATKPNTILDLDLVVLTNEASASSSEIVAGALQDRQRATIIGERTFGKGSVQHLIHLVEERGAILLTVAYYRLPSGRIIHRTKHNKHLATWGVTPDIEVTLSHEEITSIQQARRALDQNLPPEEAAETTAADTPTANPPATSHNNAVLMDRQLLAALSHLGDGH